MTAVLSVWKMLFLLWPSSLLSDEVWQGLLEDEPCVNTVVLLADGMSPGAGQEQGCLPASSAAPIQSRHRGLQLSTLAIVTPQFMAIAELGLSSSSAAVGRETSSWGLHSVILNMRWSSAEGNIVLLHYLLFCFPADCFFNQRWKAVF